MLKHIYQLATCYIYRIMQPAEGGRCRFCCRLVKRGARSFRTTNSLLIFTDHIYIILDQQTGRKKMLFWSMTLFLANWPILGQIGQFNPNDPKWLKFGWNLIFYVFPWCPNPITSLSFTIATLVALIDPWRVWLDPWGLRFQAWASSLLFLLFFAELVHCSGIGCQLA